MTPTNPTEAAPGAPETIRNGLEAIERETGHDCCVVHITGEAADTVSAYLPADRLDEAEALAEKAGADLSVRQNVPARYDTMVSFDLSGAREGGR